MESAVVWIVAGLLVAVGILFAILVKG